MSEQRNPSPMTNMTIYGMYAQILNNQRNLGLKQQTLMTATGLLAKDSPFLSMKRGGGNYVQFRFVCISRCRNIFPENRHYISYISPA